jgi:hypothetical protein
MIKRYCGQIVTSVAILPLVLTGVMYGQNSSQQQSPPRTRDDIPYSMTECEGINNCADWSFLGSQGNGKWPSGELASFVVETVKVHDDKSVDIKIHRRDSTGSSAGMKVEYVGTMIGTQIGGSYSANWPGHWDDKTKTGFWYAVLGDAPKSHSLPSTIHFCGANCATMKLIADGKYVVTTRNGFESPDFSSTWTVESFTPQFVKIHRVDTGSYAQDSIFTAQISSDGEHLTSIKWDGKPNYKVMFAWGSAICSVPGSNRERDSGQCAADQSYTPAPPVGELDPVKIHAWLQVWLDVAQLLGGSGNN